MRFCWLLIFLTLFTGCQTTARKPKQGQAETISALATVTQGLTNKPITEADLKRLAVQAQNDPQARSALQAINTALSPEHTVKYCPEDGERFSPDMIWCPDHKVKLEWVD